jgi:hypothetical protein
VSLSWEIVGDIQAGQEELCTAFCSENISVTTLYGNEIRQNDECETDMVFNNIILCGYVCVCVCCYHSILLAYAFCLLVVCL